MLPDDSSMYDALIGPAPQGADQRAVADALRRRSQMGQLGMLTTDPGMSAVGNSLVKQADSGAKQIQDTRQYDTSEADTLAQRTVANQNAADTLAESKREHDMANSLGYAHLDAMLKAAGIKASGGGHSDQNQRFLEKQAQTLTTSLDKDKIPDLESAISQYEDFVKPYVSKGESVPGIGGWKNLPYTAQVAGLFDSGQSNLGHAAQARLINIMSNMRFGARQTQVDFDRVKAEMGASPLNGTATDIKLMERLKQVVADHKTNLMAGIHPAARALFKSRQGIALDPSESESYGRAVNGESLLGTDAPGLSKGTKRIKVDENGNPR